MCCVGSQGSQEQVGQVHQNFEMPILLKTLILLIGGPCEVMYPAARGLETFRRVSIRADDWSVCAHGCRTHLQEGNGHLTFERSETLTNK